MTRVAFAGLGTAVHTLHLPAIGRVPGVELVGGTDPDPAARERFTAACGAPGFESQAELMQSARPELAVVAAPPDAHEELCVTALDAGAHVLCEKPLAATVDAGERILARAEAAGRLLSVHHGFPEQPVFRAIRERVAAEEAGRLAFCQVWQLLGQPPWEEAKDWRAQRPDRSLLEAGIHLVDLVLAVFDEAPESVMAAHSSGVHPDPDADAVQLVTLSFPDGRLGHLVIDRLSRGGDRYLELRADCEHASLRASWGGRALVTVGKKRARPAGVGLELARGGVAWEERGLRRRTLARDPREPAIAGTAELWRRLLAAIRDGGEPPSPGSRALLALRVVEAAYRSAAEGRRVALASSSRA